MKYKILLITLVHFAHQQIAMDHQAFENAINKLKNGMRFNDAKTVRETLAEIRQSRRLVSPGSINDLLKSNQGKFDSLVPVFETDWRLNIQTCKIILENAIFNNHSDLVFAILNRKGQGADIDKAMHIELINHALQNASAVNKSLHARIAKTYYPSPIFKKQEFDLELELLVQRILNENNP